MGASCTVSCCVTDAPGSTSTDAGRVPDASPLVVA